MRRFNTPRAHALYSATALLAYAGVAAAETPPCADWARLVSLQGTIEARRADGADWRPARLHDYFCPGDTLRVQRRGRAALLLRGETVVRLDQHTTLTLLASPEPGRRLLDLLSGVAHFISRVPRSLDVKTPYVNAAVEGTEFLLHIGADQILLTVYEGVVRAANAAGEARIGAGEAITVAPGRAPAPYALVRPRDAVQWALYYPPLVYYRPEELTDRPAMQRALDAQRRGDIDAAVEALAEVDDTRVLTYRAALLLSVGRADAARADLERALARAPGDSDALALSSLMATARDDRAEAMRLAQELDELNRERRGIEAEMQAQALAALDNLRLDSALPTGLCLFDPDWHQGVIGILASRIKDRLHRPVIAFAPASDTEIKGSARSVQGVHIRDILDAVAARHPGLLNKFGGHAMAAGLTLRRADLDAFRAAFDDEIRRHLNPAQMQGTLLSDGALPPADINLELAETLRNAGPWGQGFPEPVFDGVFEIKSQRLLNDKHLKLSLQHPDAAEIYDAIAFNIQEQTLALVQNATRIHVAYKLDVNNYRDRRSVQLLIEHIQPASQLRYYAGICGLERTLDQ